jgi:hypothetical protein
MNFVGGVSKVVFYRRGGKAQRCNSLIIKISAALRLCGKLLKKGHPQLRTAPHHFLEGLWYE